MMASRARGLYIAWRCEQEHWMRWDSFRAAELPIQLGEDESEGSDAGKRVPIVHRFFKK
jgi:hypothetical protein